jgi:hypothetical protein
VPSLGPKASTFDENILFALSYIFIFKQFHHYHPCLLCRSISSYLPPPGLRLEHSFTGHVFASCSKLNVREGGDITAQGRGGETIPIK